MNTPNAFVLDEEIIQMGLSPRERAKEQMRRWIEKGMLRPGIRLPSERILSEQFGVSRTTIRSALKELQEEGVIASHARGGRQPLAQPTSKGVMEKTIAVLSPRVYTGTEVAGKGFIYYVQVCASQTLNRAGYHLLHINSSSLAPDFSDELLENPPCGAIAFYDVEQNDPVKKILLALKEQDIPVVAHASSRKENVFDHVRSDQFKGGYDIAKWVIGKGCRRPLCIWITMSQKLPAWLVDREQGIRQAVRDLGVEMPEPLVIPLKLHPEESMPIQEHFSRNTRAIMGYLFEYLKGANPADALILMNDVEAIYTAEACRSLGVIPNKDILIAGYDNSWRDGPEHQISSFAPAVTIDRHNDILGQRLAEIFIERVTGNTSDTLYSEIIPHSLIVPSES